MTRQVGSIGIVGAGTMGAGIALAALYEGFPVVLQDVSSDALDRARRYLESYLARKSLEHRLERLNLVEEMEGLKGVDLVVEAALEDLALKQEVFRQLDAVCPPPAILATNTSTLSVTAIAAATETPERVAGLHFFNPAPVMPLVEVVQAPDTTPETVEALDTLARRLGKTPVRTRDTPGFIVNRVARPFYGEALRLLVEGVADHADIDRVVEDAGGFPMGPFRLMDLIGIDVNLAAMSSLYEQTFGEPRYRPHWIQQQLVAQGRLGRKTGRGFYRYDEEQGAAGGEHGEPDSAHQGPVWVSEGSWAPGLGQRIVQYGLDRVPDLTQPHDPEAALIVAGRGEGRRALIERAHSSLPSGVPLLCQASDVTVAEIASWIPATDRLAGFDGLFAGGDVITLIAGPGLSEQVRRQTEAFVAGLDLRPVWIADSPALILPRLAATLANEAAFAVLEGVAGEESVNLAMRLGVNYPFGPLEWARGLGLEQVVAVLDHLYREYREERYRACTLLRRWAREKTAETADD